MSLSVDNTLLNIRIRNSLSTRAHVKQPQVHVMGVFLACNSQYMYTQLGSCSLIKCKIICGGLTCYFGSTKVRNASLAWLSSVPYLKKTNKKFKPHFYSVAWSQAIHHLHSWALWYLFKKRLQTASVHFAKLREHYALTQNLRDIREPGSSTSNTKNYMCMRISLRLDRKQFAKLHVLSLVNGVKHCFSNYLAPFTSFFLSFSYLELSIGAVLQWNQVNISYSLHPSRAFKILSYSFLNR